MMAYYEHRLDTLRKKNDAKASTEDTAFLRGQIAEVSAILSLDADPQDFEQN